MLNKKLTSIIVLVAMLCSLIPGTIAFADDEEMYPWVLSMLVDYDYDDMSPDDAIFTDRNYNITAQVDPSNDKNICSMSVVTDHETSGYCGSYAIDPGSTGSGYLIIEEDVMYGSTDNMEYQMYLRTVEGENGHGQGFNMLTTFPNSILGIAPQVNKWMKYRYVVDPVNATYDVYLFDPASGDSLYEKKYIPLMAGFDYTKGFKEVFTRYQVDLRSPNGKIYTDNFKIYTAEKEVYDEAMAAKKAEAEKKIKQYSDAARKKLKDAVVLYIDGPYSYVNNVKKLIDPENPVVAPIIKDDRTLVPVRFVSENFGAKVTWDEATQGVGISAGGTEIKMTINNNTMTVNGQEVVMDVPPIVKNGRTLIPLRVMAESLGKYVFWDDRGLIIISGTANVFDPEADADLITEVATAKYGIKPPEIKVDQTAKLTEGVDGRKYTFTNRNSDENIKAIADELSVMLELDREELSQFKAYYEAGQYQDALAWYRDFFMTKVQTYSESYFDHTFLYPSLKDAAVTRSVDSKADVMLYNIIFADSKYLDIGEPGVVNWEHNKPEKKYDSSYFLMSVPGLWSYTTFDPLMYTYLATEDPAYIIRWQEYIDDFCMNQLLFTNMMPYDSFDSANSCPVVRDYLYRMKTLATFLGEDFGVYSETSFSRLLLKMLNDYIVQAIIYTRNNPQNWTNDQYNDLMTTGLMLDDLGLKMGDEVYRAGKRRAESFMALTFMPDGSDIEQVVAYDIVGMRGLGWIIETMKDIAPDMLSDEWYAEWTDYGIKRGTFLSHFMTPQGNFPMGFRSDTRLRTNTFPEMENYVPETYYDGVYDNRLVQNTLLNLGGEQPTFESEAFPYGGYYVFRDGWDQTSQNGMLYGHTDLVIANMGKNVFVLNAFNQDMIAAGEVGMYDYAVTQNFVDDIPQHATAGFPSWGHKGVRATSRMEPLQNRWGTSETFTFAETSYEGAYGTGLVPKGEVEKYGGQQTVSDLDSQVAAGNNVFYGVTHRRQVNFLKDAGLWVVTDRYTSEDAHKYTARWTLPIYPVKPGIEWQYKAYNEENIELDTKGQAVKTHDEGQPNISVYNFGTNDISYKQSKEEVPEWNGEKTSDFYFADVSLNGDGTKDELLISVMYPRQTEADELVSIKQLGGKGKNTVGFEAVLGDGSKVAYAVAVNKKDTFNINDVTATAESLAVSKSADGIIRGIAIGCDRISIKGASQRVDYTGFGFEFQNGKMVSITPIDYPIDMVDISPEVDSFADKLEITMSCPTPDVDIRYTTDMTEPTINSTLYKGPITITESTVIRARAFRKGVKETPVVMSCDEASVAVWAPFTKMQFKDAVATGEVEQGLNYEYYQGDWKKEYMALRDCVPVSNGKASELFDFSAKNTDGTYAFRYTGYIEAPEDGLYTIYAPFEYNTSELMTGYEMNLYIDGEQWYPSTRRYAHGTWTVALKKGLHTFELGFSDFRTERGIKEYTREGLKKQIIWGGEKPVVEISGPGIEKQPIPASMLYRDK